MRPRPLALAALLCALAGAWREEARDRPARKEGGPAVLLVRAPPSGQVVSAAFLGGTSGTSEPSGLSGLSELSGLSGLSGPQPAEPADGSAARPFPTISSALRSAPDGALIELAAGTYAEELLITRPVVLLGRGPQLTRILGRDFAKGPAIVIRGTDRVELRGLAVEGGPIGISITSGSGHRLENVSLRAFSQAALVAHDAQLVMVGSEILEVAHGASGSGLSIEGGSLEAHTLVLRAAVRRALEIKKARATLTDIDVAGSSLSALQAIDGAEVTVRESHFEHLGGAALYAGGAGLTVEDSSVRNAEYAVIGFRGARVEVIRSELRDQQVAAASFVRSAGKLEGCLIVHGGTEAAVTVTSGSGPLVLVDNRILEPGPIGVQVTQSTLQARGNTISGARLDLGNDFGDAIYALDSKVTLEGNQLTGNLGSGVTLVRSTGQLRMNDLVGNGRSGIILLDRSHAAASGNLFQRNQASGVEVAESSRLVLSGNHFEANQPLDIDLPCGQSGAADLRDGNTFEARGQARQRTCP